MSTKVNKKEIFYVPLRDYSLTAKDFIKPVLTLGCYFLNCQFFGI